MRTDRRLRLRNGFRGPTRLRRGRPIGWFTAFTIQNASYVRALGQVELIFTFLATTLFFKEKVSRTELIGIVMVAGGIVLLLLKG